MDRDGKPRSQTLKVVCVACNTGWMRQVAERAAPTLSRLGNGEWWPLSDQEKLGVATWATMFSMTWEYADKTTMVSPQLERDTLRKEKTPPQNWKIWIAGADTHVALSERVHHKALNVYSTGEEVKDLRFNTHTTTFAFGHLLLHTFSATDKLVLKATEYENRLGLLSIWPLSTTVIGQPQRLHSFEEAILVANTLEWACGEFLS